mmetsp:Transcript_7857/g.13018  ORF Transcript_7857/g.13018 Transcript_7857/m.13018 type:complete len:305 (+) Transcript_7857:129-1043(+)
MKIFIECTLVALLFLNNQHVIAVSTSQPTYQPSYGPYFCTWTNSDAGVRSWSMVKMSASGQYATGVVYEGGIYYTSDYGVSWTKSELGESAPDPGEWSTVTLDGSGQYQVAGTSLATSGKLYYSIDYGVTWTLSSSVAGVWVSSASDYTGNRVLAAPYNGYIYYSSNRGADWTQSSSALLGWQDLACDFKCEHVIAAFLGSVKIQVSSDYGVTWGDSSSITSSWTVVTLSSSGEYATAGIDGGGVYYSNDYAATWSVSDAPSGNWFLSSDYSGRYVHGGLNNGYTYISEDYGQTWIESLNDEAR